MASECALCVDSFGRGESLAKRSAPSHHSTHTVPAYEVQKIVSSLTVYILFIAIFTRTPLDSEKCSRNEKVCEIHHTDTLICPDYACFG